jgi:hypothetical protein
MEMWRLVFTSAISSLIVTYPKANLTFGIGHGVTESTERVQRLHCLGERRHRCDT